MTRAPRDERSVAADPREVAQEARLRYVSDDERGLSRRRRGRGFSYYDEAGERIAAPPIRERIEALVIPPAWEDVWICRSDRGHIQATGRDEAGRKQYVYHPRWREVSDRVKFDHLVMFASVLPAIRRKLRRDLRGGVLSRARVTAAIVKLMDTTLVRVGNAAYAKANGSYGLTTLREEHVETSGDAVDLAFEGKGGTPHALSVRDEELAAVVRACQEIEGQELFRYVDADGVARTIDSGAVNDYLREAARLEVTAKDFRTWGATVLAARALHERGGVASVSGRKRMVVDAMRGVAEVLHNTPAVCRRAYVHPRLLDAYLVGTFETDYGRALVAARSARPRELRLHEAATRTYLEEAVSVAVANSET